MSSLQQHTGNKQQSVQPLGKQSEEVELEVGALDEKCKYIGNLRVKHSVRRKLLPSFCKVLC
jgi:hypothetical protein